MSDSPPLAARLVEPPLALVAHRYFEACHIELELDDAICRAFGVDPDDINSVWPFRHMVYDYYDASFELWGVKDDGWEPTSEQLDAAFALGFAQCWVCYPDGTERHYTKTDRRGHRHPSPTPRDSDHKHQLRKMQARLQAGRLVDPRLEVCICAALYMDDDFIIRGHRHDDCLMTAAGYSRYGKGSLHKAIQGFLTTRNRFVTREEGMDLMLAANAVSAQTARPFTNRGGILFSEDLY